MIKLLLTLILLCVSCGVAKESSGYSGKYVSSYYSEGDSVHKKIKIDFLNNYQCKIVIITGDEIFDEAIYRYTRKGNWVMIKNTTTGKWSKLEYAPIDQYTFKLKVYDTDTLKTWRVFYRYTEES
jgi:phage-related protein